MASVQRAVSLTGSEEKVVDQDKGLEVDAPIELTHREILVVMSGLMLGMLVAALGQTVVATALPTIVGELGGQDQLAWVVSATLLTSTASTPLWGKMSDLYGRRPLFQAAIVVFHDTLSRCLATNCLATTA